MVEINYIKSSATMRQQITMKALHVPKVLAGSELYSEHFCLDLAVKRSVVKFFKRSSSIHNIASIYTFEPKAYHLLCSLSTDDGDVSVSTASKI